jgi:hypothetical protein
MWIRNCASCCQVGAILAGQAAADIDTGVGNERNIDFILAPNVSESDN